MPSTAERSGSFATEDATLLLQELARESFSGSVRAESGETVKVLYLADGRLACASSTDPADRLGPLLRDAGQISPQQLEMAEDRALAGEALGSVLVSLGFIGPGGLMWGARQVEKVVSSLLYWKEGEYRTRPSELPERAVNLKLSVPAMVIGAARLLPSRGDVTDRLGSLDAVLRPAGGASLPEDSDDDSREIWKLLDGERDLRSVCAESALDDFEAAKVVLGLHLLQLLEPRQAQSEGSPRTDLLTAAPETTREAEPDAEPAPFQPSVMSTRPLASDSLAGLAAPPLGDDAQGFADAPPAADDAPLSGVDSTAAAAGAEADEEILFVSDDERAPRDAFPAESGAGGTDEVYVIDEDAGEEVFAGNTGGNSDADSSLPASTSEDAPDRSAENLWEEATTPPAEENLPFGETTSSDGPGHFESRELASDPVYDPAGEHPDQQDLSFPPPDEEEFGEEVPPPPAERGGGFSRIWLVAAAFLVIAMVSAYAWLGMDDPQPLNTSIDRAPSVRGNSPEPVTPDTDETGSIDRATANPVDTPASSPPVEKPTPVPTQATATPPQEPSSGSVETVLPGATLQGGDDYGEGLAAFREGDFARAASLWSANWAHAHRQEFTLQVLVACQSSTLARMGRVVSDPLLFLLPAEISGRTCYRVGWGVYPSREAALDARGSVPDYFTAGGDRPIPVALAKAAAS